MKHCLERTNKKGVPFIGRCVLCGRRGLRSSAIHEDCDTVLTDTEARAMIVRSFVGDHIIEMGNTTVGVTPHKRRMP